MQNESVPVTIPPDVQQRHEREAKAFARKWQYIENIAAANDAYIAAARSEYTRTAGEVDRMQVECYEKCAAADRLAREQERQSMSESSGSEGEAPCREGGNYGFCRTHPTCELVQKMYSALNRERDQLRAELEAARASLDEWAPLEAGETKSLADRIRDEGHDFKMLYDHLNRTYCHFTNGRVSKPNTLPEEVFAIAEDIAREETDEQLEAARARIAELEAMAREVSCVWCGHQFVSTLGKQRADLLDHAMKCEQHPVHKANARIRDLEAEVAAMRE